ncbi:MAG: TerD family protein [Ruminococcus sp.]|jgi:stress response protein SCP2|nr:TerD family protein [Ruminococcus sp.]
MPETTDNFFDCPGVINIGALPPNVPFSAQAVIYCPSPCTVTDTADIKITPKKLSKGFNTLEFTVSPLRDGTLIYQTVEFSLSPKRVMHITALSRDSDTNPKSLLYTATGSFDEKLVYARLSGDDTFKTRTSVPGEIILERGTHFPVPGKFTAEINTSLDLDAYVFLHDGSGKIVDIQNFVYFGNDTSACGSISYLHSPERRAVFCDLDKLPVGINQIDFIWSFYANNKFDDLEHPEMIIKTNKDLIKIPLDIKSFADVKTAAVFEITRGVGFTLTPILMPFRRDLSELCRNYGLNIE